MSKALRIQAQYPTRRALLASARPEGAALSLFVPGRPDAAVGAEVVVEMLQVGERDGVESRLRGAGCTTGGR